jgi:hypothetical protein
MRWVRWGLVVMIVVPLVGLVATVMFGSATTTRDCAASAAVPTETIVATMVSRSGSAVTYSTDDGRTLVITYPGDAARFLHIGTTYRVDAWGRPGELSSTVMPYCGVPGGTLYADGTPINTGVSSPERRADELPWVVGGLVVLAGLIAALVICERLRHPRLTIDGKPFSGVR